jgi:hypothetical protein
VYVSHWEWEKVQHDAGASAEIFGVTVGASYEDFQERAKRDVTKVGSSLTQQQALNVMWTGISDNSVSAYSKCLRAMGRGLHLSVRAATEKDVTILVHYMVAGTKDPNPLAITWQPASLPDTTLPSTVPAGDTIVLVPRPQKAMQLVANGDGTGDSVTLLPLPEPPPLAPPPPRKIELKDTDFKVLPQDPPPPCDSAGSPLPARVPTRIGELYNLAQLRESSASASSSFDMYNRHATRYLNDGWYNNCRSWIATEMPAWAKVDLTKDFIISLVAFGSEYQSFLSHKSVQGCVLTATG